MFLQNTNKREKRARSKSWIPGWKNKQWFNTGTTCHNFLPLIDSLLDGSLCQLGLCEGRMSNAEVWGHKVKGGAGASRHTLHPLQGASQRLHIKSSLRPGPATPASLPLSLFCLSICFSLPSPPEGGRMAPRALATADVTGASYDNVVWGGKRHTSLLSHKQHFKWKKAPLPLSWMVLWLSLWQFYYSWYKLFNADSSSSVVCRIRRSSSILAFFFFYFKWFVLNCLIFLNFYLMLSVILLSCIIYFCWFLRRSTGVLKGFQAHLSCCVSGDFMFKNCVLYVNGWWKYFKYLNATTKHCTPLLY